MKALITGASSGIGKAIAQQLASKNIDCILIARNEQALELLKTELELTYKVNVEVLSCDLLDESNLKNVYKKYPDIDILVNNAGFGYVGDFETIPLEAEMDMISLNIKALHYLTKVYYQNFVKQNKQKYILNIGSIASFLIGPKMITYYGSKHYVLELSRALNYEAKKHHYPVSITCLCPGPTKTNFDNVANVKFSLKGDNVTMVAKKGVDGLFAKKGVVLPKLTLKLLAFISHFIPSNIQERMVYRSQNLKINK